MTDVTSEAPPRRRRLAPVAAAAAGLVILALLWVLVQAEPGDSTSADSPLLGRPAPTVVTTTTDDTPFDLSRRKGSWVLLNFFNSTCVPCVREHPELIEFHDRQQSAAEAAELYTVIWDDRESNVEAWFQANGGDWPRLRDPDGAIGVAFGVARVPETWIVDPNGFVRLRILGEVTADFLTERLDALRTGT